MKLAELTWQDAGAASKDVVVLVPTGSLEQHGPHLPLFTDSLLATAAAEAIEARLPHKVLLTPCVWLGCSGHHLSFPGSLSASFAGYEDELVRIAESLIPHGFRKFFFLNGHGGNNDSNSVVCRRLKADNPNCVFGNRGYFKYIPDETLNATLTGPLKEIRHACEAEASLMLHLHPSLVRKDKLKDDGLATEPTITGLTLHFDEVTEDGSYGYATLATAEKGKALFEAAVEAAIKEIEALADGFALRGIPAK